MLLGIDLGTTNVKAVLVSKDRLLSSGQREHPTLEPYPTWAEQSPTEWWLATVEAVRECVHRADVNPEEIEGVGVVGQREGVVPLDKKGKVLANCIIWMDRRAESEALLIRKTLGNDNVYRHTGLPIDASFTAAKLLWVKRNWPKLMERVSLLLQPKDYLVYRLTGEAVTDYSLASRTMLFDIRSHKWITEFFDELELPNLFPKVVWSTQRAGEITRPAAKELGLRLGTPVAAGCGDRPAESFGAGGLQPGVVVDSTGTTTNVNIALRKMKYDSGQRLLVGLHLARRLWLMEAGMSTTGRVLEWLRDLTGPSTHASFYEELSDGASKIPPGSEGLFVIPHFMGARAPWWQPKARGLITGLTLGHSRGHITRAIMEAVAFEVRRLLELFKELGLNVSEIRAVGGGARSRLWNQIKASVTGLPVSVPIFTDAAAYGAALLAGIASGSIRNPERAAWAAKLGYTVHPVKAWREVYENAYRRYISLVRKYLG